MQVFTLAILSLFVVLSSAELTLTLEGGAGDGCANSDDQNFLIQTAAATLQYLSGDDRRQLRGNRNLQIGTCDTFVQCMQQYHNYWMCRLTCRRRRLDWDEDEWDEDEWEDHFEDGWLSVDPDDLDIEDWSESDWEQTSNLDQISHILTDAVRMAHASQGCHNSDVVAFLTAS